MRIENGGTILYPQLLVPRLSVSEQVCFFYRCLVWEPWISLRMDKLEVARILDEIGTLLELQGENTFRCLAYHNAARTLEQLEEDLGEVIKSGRLGSVRGIGETLQEKITLLVRTGELPFYTQLRAKIPPGLLELLRLPGMGPKKVRVLYEQLGIVDVNLLKQACLEGAVAKLKGFGAKTQKNILEGIEFLGRSGQRVRIDEALDLGLFLVEGLRSCPEVQRIELCGSLRRRKETINDIDILVSSDNAAPIMDRFIGLPGVIQIVGRGETKSSVIVDRDLGRGRRVVLNADLRVVRPEQFPFALHYFTGSKEHNVAVRGRAQDYGLRLNEYALVGAEGSVPCKEEGDIFRALDLDYIAPELRENTGEIEAALEHRLPELVELGDLQGTFHCHTTWSDGTASILEMAQAAQKLGLKYLGIADHGLRLDSRPGSRSAGRDRRRERKASRFSFI